MTLEELTKSVKCMIELYCRTYHTDFRFDSTANIIRGTHGTTSCSGGVLAAVAGWQAASPYYVDLEEQTSSFSLNVYVYILYNFPPTDPIIHFRTIRVMSHQQHSAVFCTLLPSFCFLSCTQGCLI